MNVVIYARFSSHSQTEQSIEGQLKVCYEYAESNHYTVVGEYIDDTAIMGLNQNPVQTGVDLVPFFFLSALFSANEGVPA